MKNSRRTLQILLACILIVIGVAISLSLSVVMIWGELEARVYTQQTGDKTLRIECPLMIAPWEPGTIRTVVTNTLTDQATKPQVNAFISHVMDRGWSRKGLKDVLYSGM